MTDTEYKMYLIINSDLKMTPGQIGAQVSHVTQVIVDEIISSAYECFPIPEPVNKYYRWKKNPVTVVLKAPEEELKKLSKIPTARVFIDSGDRLGNDCLTVLGFYPSELHNELLSQYKLA
jgi:peptidyl-tRNA hydrolase